MVTDLVNEMLKHIPDPGLRDYYAKIANGQFTHQVCCHSKSCKGRVIGRKMALDNNRYSWVDDDLVGEDGRPVSGLASSRQRFDGKEGFRCWCGNDSILAKAEKGIIGGNPPTAEDLQKIATRLGPDLMTQPVQNGKVKVDGFTVEEIR